MMRRPELVLLALSVMLLAGGCSRLTFIKPSSKRVAFEETAPTYSVSDSQATKQRLAGQDRLALASQRFQAGDFAAAEREANAALKANPASDAAHTLLALLQDRQGNVGKTRCADLPQQEARSPAQIHDPVGPRGAPDFAHGRHQRPRHFGIPEVAAVHVAPRGAVDRLFGTEIVCRHGPHP